MSAPPIVGVGASAGGVEALVSLLRNLPSDFSAAVLVVMHLDPAGPSVLANILDRSSPLHVLPATNGDSLEAGTVYVARPNEHLTVSGTSLKTAHGPRVHGHRPAVDVTLMSIAEARGPASIGVIMSGTLDDGTRGAATIKAAGGTVLVQDPGEARHAGMIRSVQRVVDVDGVHPAAGLAAQLVALTSRPRPEPTPTPTPTDRSAAAPEGTRYTCPGCGGVLWRRTEGGATRYACSVGHVYSPSTLGIEQAHDVEAALWAAIRILGDRQALLVEMAELADEDRRPLGAERFRRSAREVDASAASIRSIVETGVWDMTDDPAETL